MTAPRHAPTDSGIRGSAAESVRVFNSRLKHFLLALPCAYLAVMGAHAVRSGTGPEGFGYALVAIGGIAAAVLMLQGFNRQPVLTIDAEGIHCRRPAVGLLPWPAITGLGFGRGMFSRVVLMVAYDEAALDAEAAARLKRERPSALFGPRLGRYQGRMAGQPTVQIPLSMLAVRPARLQRLLEQYVHYEADPD